MLVCAKIIHPQLVGPRFGATFLFGRSPYARPSFFLKHDKLSLDLFWIKDKSLTDTDGLPAPNIVAAEIVDDLQAALAQFTKIAVRLAQTADIEGSADMAESIKPQPLEAAK